MVTSKPHGGRPAARSRAAWCMGLPLLIGLTGGATVLMNPAQAELRAGPTPAPAVDARSAFRDRRYAEAYARFAEQADAGDAESAWMALTLVTLGPTMFGSEWSATAGQIQRWHRLAEQHLAQRGRRIPDHDRGE